MTTDDPIARVLAARRRLDQLRPAVEAGMPWPLASQFDHAPEASWGPNELLAHVAEMLSYWLVEVERILGGTGQPVPFGRVGTDTDRVASIGRDRALPIAELYARIDDGLARWTSRLETLTPAQLENVGLHPARGEMTVAAVVGRMLLGHLDEHIVQLEAILGGAQAPG
jgi:hypothetical protein